LKISTCLLQELHEMHNYTVGMCITTGSIHVKRNAEARSCNHCNGKAKSILEYQYVILDLVIQHGMCKRHIAGA